MPLKMRSRSAPSGLVADRRVLEPELVLRGRPQHYLQLREPLPFDPEILDQIDIAAEDAFERLAVDEEARRRSPDEPEISK